MNRNPYRRANKGTLRKLPKISTKKPAKVPLKSKENLLTCLTNKFVDALKKSPHGSIDAKAAKKELNLVSHTGARRLYDITNVLEGLEIIEMNKSSNKKTEWKLNENFGDGLALVDDAKHKNFELKMLQEKENRLDKKIELIRKETNVQLQNTSHAYVMNTDLWNIFGGQTVIVINAPPETELTVI